MSRVSVILTIAALGAACATGPEPSGSDRPPEETAVDRARAIVGSSRSRAFRRSENQESYRVALRYNPPRCDAPTFEIRVHGRWRRVWLEGSRDVRDRIDTLRRKRSDASSAERRKTTRITGRVTGERRATTGRSYPVFWVETLESAK